MKHFANKLWNIARFILASTTEESFKNSPQSKTEADNLILKNLNQAATDVTNNLERFALHEAAQAIYQFVWHELADVYLEESKQQLKDPKLANSTQIILAYSLVKILKLLHPFIPFITETLWVKIQLADKKMLMVEKW